MIDPALFKPAEEFLQAIANKKRLEVMNILTDGEICVNDLSERVGLSQSALSQHLKKLKDANLVKTRRERQKIFYSTDQKSITDLMLFIASQFVGIDTGGRKL